MASCEAYEVFPRHLAQVRKSLAFNDNGRAMTGAFESYASGDLSYSSTIAASILSIDPRENAIGMVSGMSYFLVLGKHLEEGSKTSLFGSVTALSSDSRIDRLISSSSAGIITNGLISSLSHFMSERVRPVLEMKAANEVSELESEGVLVQSQARILLAHRPLLVEQILRSIDRIRSAIDFDGKIERVAIGCFMDPETKEGPKIEIMLKVKKGVPFDEQMQIWDDASEAARATGRGGSKDPFFVSVDDA